MALIKVIYSEDEEPKDLLFGRAKDAGIELIRKESWQECEEEIRKTPSHYDLILLDARGKYNKDGKAEDLASLPASLHKVRNLRNEFDKVFPVIVFTANPDEAKEYLDDDIHIISKVDGYSTLFDKIQEEAEKTIQVKVRNDYPGAFRVFEKGILDESYKDQLVEIISAVYPNGYQVSHSSFTGARKLIEGVFHALIDREVIPDEFRPDGTQLRAAYCNRFLSGKPTNSLSKKVTDGFTFQLNAGFLIPTRIEKSIDHILDITNPESHYYIGPKTKNIRWALSSIAYQLIDVLSWLPDYIENEVNGNGEFFTKETRDLDCIENGATRIFEGPFRKDRFVGDCFVSASKIRDYYLEKLQGPGGTVSIRVIARLGTNPRSKRSEWQAEKILSFSVNDTGS